MEETEEEQGRCVYALLPRADNFQQNIYIKYRFVIVVEREMAGGSHMSKTSQRSRVENEKE